LNSFQKTAICVYAEDVPKGGLTLGEIRTLSTALVNNKCSKCGHMTVNYLSKNESELGLLNFNWADSICLDNCIDPSKDLNTTSNNAT
jgi:hypothetical protein